MVLLSGCGKSGVRLRKLKLLCLMLVVLPFCAFSCSGCMTPFEAATLNPRPGRMINGRAAVVYSSRYEIDLWGFEKAHSFDIHKYRKMAMALVNNGYLSTSDLFVPGEVGDDMLRMVHTSEYLAKLRKSSNVGRYLENPKVGILPGKTTDARLLRAFRVSTGGTVLAARLAWQCGLGINLGGGYHHAHTDHGAGFCIYADVPVLDIKS